MSLVRGFNLLQTVTKTPQRLQFIHTQPKKRFYKNVSVVQANGKFEINLDHRKLKTPMGSPLLISSETLAHAVAGEWSGQKDVINMSQMHINGLCNTVVDNPGRIDKQRIVKEILNFLETDTVLFYGEEPPELLRAQMEQWSPVILWFRDRFGVSVEPTTDVMTAPVQSADLNILDKYLMSYSEEALHGFSFAVDALKSLILATACVERRLSISEAVSLARLELSVQTRSWGSVEWAHDIEGHDTTARAAAGIIIMSKRNSSAVARLKQDYIRLRKDPVPYIVAEPLPSNILEWHYVVRGPDDSVYKGGMYHGKLVFPSEFPFKPPSIFMTTPNGRFKTDTRLCLSISDYHPDTWNPAWSVSTILTGLLSFMLERSPTLGSVETSDWEKKQFALKSLEFNLKSRVFCELFPSLKTEILDELEKRRVQGPAERVHDRQDPGAALDSQANYGVFGNVLVIGGFAAFAFVVRYVLQTMAALE